jgi:hypothetical protein
LNFCSTEFFEKPLVLLWYSGLAEDILSGYGVQPSGVAQHPGRAGRDWFKESPEGKQGQNKLGMNGLVAERF